MTLDAATPDATVAASAAADATCLRVENLHKTYSLGRVKVPVLRGVDLSVAQGEFAAILGASGSGKSTLLHLVGGLDRPDRPAHGVSSIRYRGREFVGASRSTLDAYRAKETGFVFQFYHLLPELTVMENILVASMVRWGLAWPAHRSRATRAAEELVEHVGLSHRRRHRPAELSGGERQRVAIARALINEPTLLLADEPTGNLDQKTGETILEMLLAIRAARRLTMLVVTHDQRTAARADRVVRLEDGRVSKP
ncbi:MAG: ABC transporter ATP-binding protein [Phycisphaerae bacterium]|jgi:ABC-type lipoprotein export system ATPase subunit